jgi:hypothetical protein
VDTSTGVDDRALGGIGAHGAGSDRVVVAPHLTGERRGQALGVVIADPGRRRQLGSDDQLRQRRSPDQSPRLPQSEEHAFPVLRVAQVRRVDARRGVWIGAGQPHRAAGIRLDQGEADAQHRSPAAALESVPNGPAAKLCRSGRDECGLARVTIAW